MKQKATSTCDHCGEECPSRCFVDPNLGYQKRTRTVGVLKRFRNRKEYICVYIYIVHNVNRYIGMCLVTSNLVHVCVCMAYMMYIYSLGRVEFLLVLIIDCQLFSRLLTEASRSHFQMKFYDKSKEIVEDNVFSMVVYGSLKRW